jgi:hypothetical protein
LIEGSSFNLDQSKTCNLQSAINLQSEICNLQSQALRPLPSFLAFSLQPSRADEPRTDLVMAGRKRMLKSYYTTAIAVLMAGTIALAQAPQPAAPDTQRPGQTPTTQAPTPGQQPATAAKPATITLTGCLVREEDVPGRKPNVAERAGVGEDYILTQATAAAQPTGTSGSASAPASRNISSMYKVEGIPDEKLKSMLGKRVEVIGRVDADDAREVGTTGAASATPRTPSDDMPEFEATAIREVEGSCSAAQPRQ